MLPKMFRRAACALALAVLLAVAGWVARPGPTRCDDADAACMAHALQRHPATRAASWQAAMRRPALERVGAAPADLVAYLAMDNRLHGYRQQPRAATLTPDFLADVHRAMADIPPRVWELVAPTFAGIALVDGLGSSGFTTTLRDGAGVPSAAVVVLDAGLLADIRGNAWATWKENTPFRWDGLHRLRVTLAEPADDGRVAAIRFILLHELGHVLSVGRDLHPAWDAPAPASLDRYPFADIAWRIDAARHVAVPRDDHRFAGLDRLVYYTGARLRADERASVYQALAATSFPTLYAAVSPGDDFAESFASYVHVVLLRQPWRVDVTGAGGAAATFGPCWDEPRCARKRAILERLLGPSGSSRPAAG